LFTLERQRGERLARRDSVTYTRKVKLLPVLAPIVQQRGVVRRYGEKKGRTVAFDVGVDTGRGRTGRGEDRRGAAVQGEIAGVPQAVRKEQASDTVTSVPIVHVQNAPGVQLGAHHHIAMKMDARFGSPGASGRVQPEGRSILGGGFCFEPGGGSIHCLAQGGKALVRPPDGDQFTQIPKPFSRYSLKLWQQGLANQSDACVGIV